MIIWLSLSSSLPSRSILLFLSFRIVVCLLLLSCLRLFRYIYQATCVLVDSSMRCIGVGATTNVGCFWLLIEKQVVVFGKWSLRRARPSVVKITLNWNKLVVRKRSERSNSKVNSSKLSCSLTVPVCGRRFCDILTYFYRYVYVCF